LPLAAQWAGRTTLPAIFLSLHPCVLLGDVCATIKANKMTRRIFFLGLITYGLLTGLIYRIVALIDRIGWTDAAVYVFSISVIVWVAIYIGVDLIAADDDDEPVGKLDEVVGIIGLLLCSIPYAPECWLGVTILTGWLVITTVPQTSMHRGALILLATSFPMLWSRVIFRFLSEPILLADAWIVAKLLNTANEGTHIYFADKSGVLEVSPACSSWANVSLVLLTWIVLCQYQKRAWQLLDLGWYALVILTVVGINTIRMAMMGISEQYYVLIHGTVGSTITSWMIVGATVVLCLWGTRSSRMKNQKSIRI
jgi:hypothetical protein